MRRTIPCLLLFTAACGERPQPPGARSPVANSAIATADAKTPAARIGKDVITLGEVDATIVGPLRTMDFEHQKQVHQARTGALDQLIMDRVLGPKAKAKNQSVEDYVKAIIEGRVSAASEVEAKAFFDQNTEQMGGATFDQIKDRIIHHLTNQKRAEAFQKYMDDERKAASVEVMLPEPEEPRVEVAAIGPSKGPEGAPITIVEFSDFQ